MHKCQTSPSNPFRLSPRRVHRLPSPVDPRRHSGVHPILLRVILLVEPPPGVEEPHDEGGLEVGGLVVDGYPVGSGSIVRVTADAQGSDAGVGEGSDGELAFDLGEMGDVDLIIVVLYTEKTVGEKTSAMLKERIKCDGLVQEE